MGENLRQRQAQGSISYSQSYARLAPRKEPFFSLVASFFIPGLGTILNGEVARGIAFMACFYLSPVAGFALMFVALFVSSAASILSFLFLGLAAVVSLGVWVWGMIDAYRGAELHNSLHGLH